MIILRDYQKKGNDLVFEEWKEHNSTLLCVPTGCGKTEMFSQIIARIQPQRTLVLAHREELIFQAKNRIERSTGLECDVEMAHLSANANLFRPDRNAPVVVGSIQTQIAGCNGDGRMTKFDPMQFGLLVIDEAHRAVSPSYLKVIQYYKKNPDLRILGVTATPDRTDEEALGQVFESVAFDYEILDAINDGWLVPIEQRMVYINGLDFSHIRTTCGDLNGGDLAAVMEAEKNLQGVAGAAIDIIGNRRTLVFTASVAQAEKLSEIFNRHKAGMAQWVCGKTNKDERREMLAAYNDGKIQVMVNCNCLSEGFDSPGVEVVIQAKPTKSRSLYAQQIGRATRPLVGVVDGPETPELRRAAIAASPKPCCEVVDFVGNSGKHKLMSSADILGGNVSEEALERAVANAKKSANSVRMSDELIRAEEELKKEREARRLSEEARRAKLVANVKYTSKSVSPFDVFAIEPKAERGWDRGNGKVLTEKQTTVLLKQGINPEGLPYVQQKQILLEIFNRWDKKLCSFKQAKLLKKNGIDASKITREQASRVIDRMALGNWRPLTQDQVQACLNAKSSAKPVTQSLPQYESGSQVEPEPEGVPF